MAAKLVLVALLSAGFSFAKQAALESVYYYDQGGNGQCSGEKSGIFRRPFDNMTQCNEYFTQTELSPCVRYSSYLMGHRCVDDLWALPSGKIYLLQEYYANTSCQGSFNFFYASADYVYNNITESLYQHWTCTDGGQVRLERWDKTNHAVETFDQQCIDSDPNDTNGKSYRLRCVSGAERIQNLAFYLVPLAVLTTILW